MAWASFANLIPNLPDFFGKGVDYAIGSLGGMPDSKARKNQIHDIRTLRRREYQDMVHSLTQAGLNPILAVGASPGHASAQMLPPDLGSTGSSGGVGSAYAAHRTAGVAEKRVGSEIGKNEAAAGLANVQGTATQLGIPNILQQWDLNSATIDRIKQDSKTGLALQHVYEQDAIHKGASADKLRKDIEMLDKFGPPGQTLEGMLRAYFPGPDKTTSTAKSWWDSISAKHDQAEADRESGKDTTWRPPSLYRWWKENR